MSSFDASTSTSALLNAQTAILATFSSAKQNVRKLRSLEEDVSAFSDTKDVRAFSNPEQEDVGTFSGRKDIRAFSNPEQDVTAFSDAEQDVGTFSGRKDIRAFSNPEQDVTAFSNPEQDVTAFSDADGTKDIRAFSNPEQDVTAFSDAEQDVTAFSNPEQAVTAFSNPEQDVTAFSNPEQDVTAFSDAEQDVTAFSDAEQDVTAFSDADQDVTAFSDAEQDVTAFSDADQDVTAFSNPEQDSAMMACEKLNTQLQPFREKLPKADWTTLVMAALDGNADLSAEATHHYNNPQANLYATYMAGVVETEVDVLTGESQISRVDLLGDFGASINPTIDIGQIEGAFVMGLGAYLTEDIFYSKDTGKMLNDGTWEYKPPSTKDIPIDWRIHFLPDTPNPVGILSSKAAGEPPIGLAMAALLSIKKAVESVREDLTGEKLFLPVVAPFTVEKVFLGTGIQTSHLVADNIDGDF
ncbi:LOW QUALITY PROTEIN: xanthine dehydrogenase [Plakobranchus ocellatus]|uniref:Xanthine dehydrogenase n=1 Tax=Plakobranchus ocellatus TaxID=259542 RepID=A0AAV4CM34_9GAST|nr:LOW QUALITY PROTEIN: xanthine dehydrogenase [Plakobranchus ocellatus]